LGINQVDFAATKGLGLGMLALRQRGFSQVHKSTTWLGWPLPELEQVLESY